MSCDLVVLLSLAGLTGLECDAVKEWSNIVELAKRSNVWIYSFCVLYIHMYRPPPCKVFSAMHKRTCATIRRKKLTFSRSYSMGLM